MSGEEKKTVPKRGGDHSTYGIFIGGSPLDKEYKPTRKLRYRSHMQRRNVKAVGHIESALIAARDSTTSLKFNGNLEPTVGASVTEIGKDRFISMLERKVEELGQETFYYVQNETKDDVVNLFEHSHNFTIKTIIKEFEARQVDTHIGAFDAYELDEIFMSRLVVETLLSSSFYDKIVIRFGQRDDFKELPGSVLFLMALETCNSSVSSDVDKAETDFNALSLDSYPGENIADFASEAQRLIKKMGGGYVIPIHTGSRLLIKVSTTSSEEFNRKIFAILDSVKDMEYKYKMMDPGKMTKDSKYSELGPLGLLSSIQQSYSRLLSFQDWPALASKLPESNNAAAANIKALDSSGSGGERKCFRCGGDHHVRDCPKKAADKANKDKDKDKGKSDSDAPAQNKPKTDELPAWRYLEPKDLTVPLVDSGRSWKFCTKCKCKKSGRVGFYILSHFDSEHDDNYVPKQNEGNLAAVDMPLSLPEATLCDPSSDDFDTDIEFQGVGAWCTSVDPTGITFVPSLVERENVEPTSDTELCPSLLNNHGPTTCVAVDTPWDPTWPCLRPTSQSLLSGRLLSILSSTSFDSESLDSDQFVSAYEVEPLATSYDGFDYYDPEPADTLTDENLRILAHFVLALVFSIGRWFIKCLFGASWSP
jgi:hypothetical protein